MIIHYTQAYSKIFAHLKNLISDLDLQYLDIHWSNGQAMFRDKMALVQS